MKDALKIRSMFASISRRYDLLNHLLSLNQDKRWRKKAVEMSGLDHYAQARDAAARGSMVLDVCTGTADLALAYSDYVGSGGLVVGTDFCPEMLSIGKRKAHFAANGTTRPKCEISLMAADTLALPFRDETFDVVSVAFGIRNVADTEAGISEMTRVAKEHGRVVILEFSLPDNKLVGSLYKVYFTRLLPLIGRVVSRADNDAYSYLPDSVLKFPQGDEMCEIMRAHGLIDVSAMSLSKGIVSLYIGRKSAGKIPIT